MHSTSAAMPMHRKAISIVASAISARRYAFCPATKCFPRLMSIAARRIFFRRNIPSPSATWMSPSNWGRAMHAPYIFAPRPRKRWATTREPVPISRRPGRSIRKSGSDSRQIEPSLPPQDSTALGADALLQRGAVALTAEIGVLHRFARGEFRRRPAQGDAARLQHIAAIGDAERGARVLLDQKDRVAGGAQRHNLRHDPLHHQRREAERRLVEQHETRPRHHGARDRHHLLL